MTQIKRYTRQNGSECRRIRRERGIKVGQLAALVDAAPSTIHGLENGNRGASIELLHRIGRALDVPVKALLADREASA